MEIQFSRTAGISGRAVGYARRKLAHLTRYSREPVEYAHIAFAVSANPSVALRVRVYASLVIDGRVVRAHADGTGARQAVDGLDDKLRRQLGRTNPHWQNRGRILRRDPAPAATPSLGEQAAPHVQGWTVGTTAPPRTKAL